MNERRRFFFLVACLLFVFVLLLFVVDGIGGECCCCWTTHTSHVRLCFSFFLPHTVCESLCVCSSFFTCLFLSLYLCVRLFFLLLTFCFLLVFGGRFSLQLLLLHFLLLLLLGRVGVSAPERTHARAHTHIREKPPPPSFEKLFDVYCLLWILVIAARGASIINIHSYKELYTINFRDALLNFLLPVLFFLSFRLKLKLVSGWSVFFFYFFFFTFSVCNHDATKREGARRRPEGGGGGSPAAAPRRTSGRNLHRFWFWFTPRAGTGRKPVD